MGEKQYAVLTGDIVGSSRFDPASLMSLMQRLRDGAAEFSTTNPGAVCGRLDVYSGDSWQWLLEGTRLAMRAAVYMRALARGHDTLKADTRVAIGVGRINPQTLNPDRISETTGEAFEGSGRGLREMKKPVCTTWIEPADESRQSRFLLGSLRLLDSQLSRWKPRQSQAIALALLGLTQQQIADRLGISQPTVNSSLKGAGWKGIEGFLSEIEI